ncbi:MAG: aminopeptidase P family protein [Deltaproteobacteria bacterium]|jgi:Xaa-Pro aminopeptidase|nr:aminopeptidase P family protein [Deltaproteobacteria bacterium]
MNVDMAAPGVGGRLDKLRELIDKNLIWGLIITCPENRRYYSGFTATDPMLAESSGALLIVPKKAYLLTDGRYLEVAGQEAPDFEVVDTGPGGLGRTVANLIKRSHTLAFEPKYFTFSQFWHCRSDGGLNLVPCPFDPSDLRAAKSPDELNNIEKALEITEKALGWLFERLEPGWTEGEAAWFLDSTFRELGAQGPSFDTIVASGPRASLPHAEPGEKKIQEGELVVIDCGARYRGYAADITRTYIKGQPQKWQADIYRTVREAQLKAIEVMGPGVPCRMVDKVARDHIAEAGHSEHFGHSLGHGVGLAIHESPSLNPRSVRRLEPGAVVTVEPGIYLPGQGGVRLEQLVLITEDGAKVLNRDRHFYDF